MVNENNNIELLKVRFGIIGHSKQLTDVINRLVQAAPTDLTILITGETGTGKEVFANAIHGLSKRKKFPFISVNCGAIPETLLESELFGHEKGAFTGAIEQRKGFFEVANNGTIFLDEIGEMPFSTQVKLLRILESGEFSRLGSSTVHKVNCRIIAATNRELEEEVRNGNFRQDLFFRLNSVHLVLPPLRNHLDDIPYLVQHFAKKISEKLGLDYIGPNEDAINILKNLPWAGNVRELRNLIETMITLERTSIITSEILRRYIPAALPAHISQPVINERAIVTSQRIHEPQGFELEIIFRTLLEMKNEMNDVKNYLRNIALDIQDLKSQAQVMQDMRYEPIETTKEIIEDNIIKINDMEKNMISSALKKYNGNRRLTAKSLGISERTLYRKLTDYGLV